jgi:hypothetical protein
MTATRAAVLIAGVPRSGTTWIGRALGRSAGAAYVNEPDGFRDPFAFRTMLARGENPVLAPGDEAPDVERLWAGALAGGRPAGTVRDRIARALYERAPLDDRRRARARGHASGRLRLVAALAVPRVADPDHRDVVVKSVQCALALEWIAARFAPRVLVVERNPLNVLASWAELDYVRSDREREVLAAYAQRTWGLEAPAAAAPRLAVQAFAYGVQTSALREAASRHPEWVRTSHEHLCVDSAARFAALAAELGLAWGEDADRFLRDSDREGTPYRTLRRTEEQPDRWRERLDDGQVAMIRETLSRFPFPLVAGT